MRCDNLVVGYDGKVIVGNISFEIGPGECVLLCGTNGTGKTTLLRTIAGLMPPLSGKISLDKPSANDIIMIPSRVPKVKGFTVMEFIAAGISVCTDWLGRLPVNLRRRITDALAEFGISDLEERDISMLSDGEFQKACIVSAVVHDAGFLIFDEPTAFLDVDSRVDILGLLKTLTYRGRSVIFSSHDIHEAIECSTRVFGLRTRQGVDEPSVLHTPTFVDSGPSASLSIRHSVVSSCFTTFIG